MKRHALLLVLICSVLLAVAPTILPPFYVRVGQMMLYSAGLGLAWAILGGFAGYGSFGHAGFIGVGAFAAGLTEDQFTSLPAPLALLVGLGAGACGIVESRLIKVPVVTLAHLAPEVFFYEAYLLAGLLVLYVAWRIKQSRFGAGLLAIREDEDTARMLGVPTERYKRIAFVISAVLTGLLGVIYAHSLGYITTDSVYRDDTNLNLVVFSLLGGMGTLFGPIIGAFLLVFITQVILGRLLDFHLFATGLLLVILVLAAPGGILGFVRTRVRRRRSVTAAP